MTRTPWWVLLAVMASGCAMQKVEPWDRELLARPEMSFASPDGELRGRTYQSKEGSSGGGGAAPVGCGCN
jgi:hypothetical protein